MRAWLCVGTQRSGPGTGLSCGLFDTDTGRLAPPHLVAVADDPAWFVPDPSRTRLYACNSGTPGGVSAWAVDGTTGALTHINSHTREGRGPSHLSLDRTGRFVLSANYHGGYIEVIALAADGRLAGQTALVRHAGRSVHAERQTGAHPHCVLTDPDNQYAVVADLGLDRVFVYRFDAAAGTLAPHDPPYVQVNPGSGPRHLAWGPDGRQLYLVEELSSELTVFDWRSDRGVLEHRQTVTALPVLPGAAENTSAEILVHPAGRHVYVSNRGHDSIASFAIGDTVTPLGHVPSGGRMPRYLAFDPTARWLVAANHDSDTVAVFRIDPDTGRLTPTGHPVVVRRPYGMAFLPFTGGDRPF
jgi:6-phosphogluconolactonase